MVLYLFCPVHLRYMAWSVVYDKVKIKHTALTRKTRVSGNTLLCLGVSVSSLELADRSSRNLVRLKIIPLRKVPKYCAL